jgi:alcohol dehydrogenase (cytochrome c)
MSAGSGLLATVLLVVLVVLATLPAHAQPGPTQAELNAAAANATDWLHTNHDYGGQRFVDARGISRSNASALQPTCRYEVGDLFPFHTNPIVYRGVMYLTTPSDTIAVDAATCALRWRHHWEYKARPNWAQSRGVALKAGTIVRGTRDGFLLALDADTGRLLWERAAGDAAKGETFTMPPVIFEDLVIIGPAGNEVPIQGWVGAFKLKDGDPVWRFNTVPRPGEPGAETWSPTDVPTGGGAVWTPFSLDPAEGLLFVATGNPAPDFYTDVRQGANLYTSSLVVLDARTGKRVWHHQATPHDFHDWDLTQVSPLFHADVDGKPRRLVSVVGKEGLLRILDRESRAQVVAVPVTRRQNVEVPVTEEGVHACPGVLGGVQWNGPAFSPRTNMLYVPSVDWCGTFKKAGTLVHVPGQNYLGGTWLPDPMDQSRGWLTAIDASTGAIRWRYESRRPMLAAVTVTSADLVFTGELGGDFLVLDAKDGTVLFRHNTGGAMNGGIVTYQLAGKQYVATTSGSATRFWRTPPAPASVTIFALPAPPPREDTSTPREKAVTPE